MTGSVGQGTPAPLPSSSIPKPKKTYKKITIRDNKTKQLKRVLMESSKADKILQNRKAKKTGGVGTQPAAAQPKKPNPLAEVESLIPKPYQGQVDPKGINKAVNALINAGIIPLNDLKKQQQLVYDQNIKDLNSFLAQTQSTNNAALANTLNGTGLMQGAAAQQAAALKQGNNQAAQELMQLMAGSQNPQLADMVSSAFNNSSVQNNQQAVENYNLAGLGGQYQGDFFNRAKALAGAQSQDAANRQALALANINNSINAQIAAKKAERPNLIRQLATEEGQAALESLAAAQAFDLDMNKLKLQTEMDLKKLQSNENIANMKLQNSAANTNAKNLGRYGIHKKYDSVIDDAIDSVNSMLARVGTVKDPNNPNAGTFGYGEVFKARKGAWRESFYQMQNKGVPANVAALISTSAFGESFQKSTPKKLLTMMQSRGVDNKTANAIVLKYFPNAFKKMSPKKKQAALNYFDHFNNITQDAIMQMQNATSLTHNSPSTQPATGSPILNINGSI